MVSSDAPTTGFTDKSTPSPLAQAIRNLLRNLADEGRTVFVSSHLMSEMSLMADQLIVVGRGKLIADTTVEDFIRQASSDTVRVRTPEPQRLALVLAANGVTVVSGNETDHT